MHIISIPNTKEHNRAKEYKYIVNCIMSVLVWKTASLNIGFTALITTKNNYRIPAKTQTMIDSTTLNTLHSVSFIQIATRRPK